MKAIRTATLFLTAALAVSQASTLGYVSDGTTIYTIDPTSGAVLDTQTLSVGSLDGMAINSGGTLFGDFNNSGVGQLGAIDPTTGNVTPVGSPFTDASRHSWSAGPLAFDQTGALYSYSGESILLVDPSSGFVTDELAVSGGVGFAFDASCTAWLSDGGDEKLYSVGQGCGGFPGPPTGSGTGGTPVEPTNPTGSGPFQAYITALSTTSNGLFFGILTNSPGSLELISFNPDTASNPIDPTVIGGLPSNVTSLAIESDFTPEPAGVALMGIGLAALLFYRRRRVR